MQQKRNTIGPRIQVDFPDLHLSGVPAKVDTGADSSALWASDISEADGVVSFVLFGRTSPFYTGERLSTKKYTVSAVKNSFGDTEFRYKVQLSVVLAGRKLKARFTLADRSTHRFPILIGRRTLHGRFVVDVASHEQTPQRILVLCTHKITSVERFLKDIEKQDKELRFTFATYAELVFSIDTKTHVTIGRNGPDIASFDLVYFKTIAHDKGTAASAAHYLQNRGVPFMDKAVIRYDVLSKLFQYVLLCDAGIPVPQSMFMATHELMASYKEICSRLGTPFILKDVHGNKGENNFLVKDKDAFDGICKQAQEEDLQLIAQQFIPNDGDYRLAVFGRRIRLVIHRSANDSHLNNTSTGAKAALVDLETLPRIVRDQSLQAAQLVQRDVAGVDMVEDKTTGSWYCLEVNGGPQIASGAFVTEKEAAFASFLHKRLSSV